MEIINTLYKGERIRLLKDGNAIQGAMYLDSNKILSPFLDVSAQYIRKNIKGGSRILILGGGTYTLPRNISSSISLDIVELEKEMFEIAKKSFKYEKQKNANYFFMDAALYVELTGNHYDLVVVDIFDGKRVPKPFRKKKFYDDLYRITNKVIVNECYVNDFDYGKFTVEDDINLLPGEKTHWHYKLLFKT
jgi:predicted membrane-bound spermidine synthase